jgi:hypothetical protein
MIKKAVVECDGCPFKVRIPTGVKPHVHARNEGFKENAFDTGMILCKECVNAA